MSNHMNADDRLISSETPCSVDALRHLAEPGPGIHRHRTIPCGGDGFAVPRSRAIGAGRDLYGAGRRAQRSCALLGEPKPTRPLRAGDRRHRDRPQRRLLRNRGLPRRAGRGARQSPANPLWTAYRGLALPLGLAACWSSPIKARRRPRHRHLRILLSHHHPRPERPSTARSSQPACTCAPSRSSTRMRKPVSTTSRSANPR